MEHRWDPHAEVICPYDETHVLSVKRFQRHLVKCRQNHPDKDFVSCPFNAMHMILRSELRKHLAKCVDRVSLDDDVLQDRDPETGEEFRLKGKTDMPRAPEIVEVENDDWDDEIEENLSLKLAEQEEYIRLQGLLARAEEEPLLRRPNFDSTPKPIFPVHNQPVFADYENCTALRRPNLATNEAVSDNERKVQTGGKSKGTEMTLEERCELINKGILSLETLQLSSNIENSPQSDCDNESIASDSTWVSSIYEPIKRNTSNKNKQEKKTDGLHTKLACKGVARTEQKPKPGISRGQLLKALENSLSSSSRTISVNKDSREDSSASLNKKEDPIQKPPKQGMGRGFFKMAALNFQKPS